MSDEIQQVENAGQEFFGVYADTFKILHNFMSEVTELKNSLPHRQPNPKDDTVSQMLDSGLTSFKFTGNDTDLCYFAQSDTMPVTAIANIGDENIKQSVLSTFDRFVKNGSLELKNGSLHITPKGKKLVQNEFFIRQANADQKQVHNSRLLQSAERENTRMIAFTGNYVNDFTYFYYSDTLDLKDIAGNPNKKVSESILGNVKKWQKNGAVTIQNGVATVTPDGKALLNMPEFQKKVTSYLHPKELADFNIKSSQLAVKIPTAVKTAVQKNALKNTVTKAIKR